MSEFCCPFCGKNHGPDPRANRRPCPKGRALKYDSDGTISHFKLYGVKGWQHKTKLIRREPSPLPYVGTVNIPVRVEMDN